MPRPEKPFDWDLVDSLAANGASEWFVAERLVLKDREEPDAKKIENKIRFINRRIRKRYNMSYVQYRDKKEESYRIKLRQTQRKVAIEDKSVPMLIWLGKVDLGQKEKAVETKGDIKITYREAKKK